MGAYEELLARLKDIDLVGQIGSLLSWDQEVLMPPKAAPLRAEQLAWISKTSHERLTDSKIGSLLEQIELDDDLDDVQRANIRLTRESYDRATKLPTEFVEEMAKHRSKALVSWTEARQKDDFSIFRASGCNAKSPIKSIKSVKIKKIKNKIEFEFRSQSFLKQQVRSMVGCLKYIGEKKWTLKKFISVIKLKNRNLCAPPAPAEGLFLKKVLY